MHGPRSSRRRAIAFVLRLAVAATLVGCRLTGTHDSAKLHLVVWSMWSGQEEQNFKAVLRAYMQLHPDIEVQNLGAVSQDDKTVRAIVAGVPPDVATLSDSNYLGPLAANGAVQPLNAQFEQARLRRSSFVKASLDMCSYKGRLYGMPFLIDDVALLWNKRAFREVGLNPDQPPRTLDELKRYAELLTKHNSAGALTRLGIDTPGDLYVMFKLFGGGLVDPVTGRITADAPGNVAALAWYCGLIKAMGGYQTVTAFTSGFGNVQGPNNSFYRGKTAMKLDGEWNPRWIARYAPNLEYGVAAVPPTARRPEMAGSTWFGGNILCIPRGCKHPQAAWNLLAWMQSDEAQGLFASLMNNVPNTQTALRLKQLRTGEHYRTMFAHFLDLAEGPRGFTFPVLPVATLVNNELGHAEQMALLGRETPAQALHIAQVRAQRELNRYR